VVSSASQRAHGGKSIARPWRVVEARTAVGRCGGDNFVRQEPAEAGHRSAARDRNSSSEIAIEAKRILIAGIVLSRRDYVIPGARGILKEHLKIH